MKQLFFILFSLISVTLVSAQKKSILSSEKSPVAWSFTSTHVAGDQYVVRITATIKSGWHIYAQAQPKGAIGQPIKFTFNKNPFLVFEGPVNEVGELEEYREGKVVTRQYSNQVVFAQKVIVKGKAKTSVTGNLVYQSCTGKTCLRPETVKFTIALD